MFSDAPSECTMPTRGSPLTSSDASSSADEPGHDEHEQHDQRQRRAASTSCEPGGETDSERRNPTAIGQAPSTERPRSMRANEGTKRRYAHHRRSDEHGARRPKELTGGDDHRESKVRR